MFVLLFPLKPSLPLTPLLLFDLKFSTFQAERSITEVLGIEFIPGMETGFRIKFLEDGAEAILDYEAETPADAAEKKKKSKDDKSAKAPRKQTPVKIPTVSSSVGNAVIPTPEAAKNDFDKQLEEFDLMSDSDKDDNGLDGVNLNKTIYDPHLLQNLKIPSSAGTDNVNDSKTKPSGVFVVGAKVMARLPSWSKMYPGKIISEQPNNKFEIEFEDGDCQSIKKYLIEPTGEVNSAPEVTVAEARFCVGAKVEARLPSWSKMYPGKILSEKPNNKFEIEFEDGDRQCIKKYLIKLVGAPAPAPVDVQASGSQNPAGGYVARDGSVFATEREYLKHLAKQGWFECRDLKDGTIVRKPGEMYEQMFEMCKLTNCEIQILDNCNQVIGDYLMNCRGFIGPSSESVFLRDCKNCTFTIACKQLRLRDCHNCTFYLYSHTDPVIEATTHCSFAPFNGAYAGLRELFSNANLDPDDNHWCEVFDFHKDEIVTKEGQSIPEPHWIKLPEESWGSEQRIDLDGVPGVVENPVPKDAVSKHLGEEDTGMQAHSIHTSAAEALDQYNAAGEGEGEGDAAMASGDAGSNVIQKQANPEVEATADAEGTADGVDLDAALGACVPETLTLQNRKESMLSQLVAGKVPTSDKQRQILVSASELETASVKQKSGLFVVGAKVMARLPSWSKMYPGKIISEQPNNKFEIEFEDGDCQSIKKYLIEPTGEVNSAPEVTVAEARFCVGAKVEARLPSWSKMYPGKILSEKPNNKFEIEFEDGDRQCIKKYLIKLVGAPAPAPVDVQASGSQNPAGGYVARDGSVFATEREYLKHLAKQGWFECRDLKDGTIVRKPGEMYEQMFEMCKLTNCEIQILDNCNQVIGDYLMNCRGFIGPSSESVFLRDCKNCTFTIACKQLRLRDCHNCTFYLYSHTDPVIEATTHCSFAPFNGAYAGLRELFSNANLDPDDNHWCEVFDFHKDEIVTKEGQSIPEPHWIKLPEESWGSEQRIDLDGVPGVVENPVPKDAVSKHLGEEDTGMQAHSIHTSAAEALDQYNAAGEGEGEGDAAMASGDAESNVIQKQANPEVEATADAEGTADGVDLDAALGACVPETLTLQNRKESMLSQLVAGKEPETTADAEAIAQVEAEAKTVGVDLDAALEACAPETLTLQNRKESELSQLVASKEPVVITSDEHPEKLPSILESTKMKSAKATRGGLPSLAPLGGNTCNKIETSISPSKKMKKKKKKKSTKDIIAAAKKDSETKKEKSPKKQSKSPVKKFSPAKPTYEEMELQRLKAMEDNIAESYEQKRERERRERLRAEAAERKRREEEARAKRMEAVRRAAEDAERLRLAREAEDKIEQEKQDALAKVRAERARLKGDGATDLSVKEALPPIAVGLPPISKALPPISNSLPAIGKPVLHEELTQNTNQEESENISKPAEPTMSNTVSNIVENLEDKIVKEKDNGPDLESMFGDRLLESSDGSDDAYAEDSFNLDNSDSFISQEKSKGDHHEKNQKEAGESQENLDESIESMAESIESMASDVASDDDNYGDDYDDDFEDDFEEEEAENNDEDGDKAHGKRVSFAENLEQTKEIPRLPAEKVPALFYTQKEIESFHFDDE